MSDLAENGLTPDQTRRFDRAMRRMRRPRRDMLLWKRKEGLTYDEIADLYGITPERAQEEVTRALIQLSRRVFGDPRPWWRRWQP